MGDEPRLFPAFFQGGQIIVAGVIVRRVRRVIIFEAQPQLRSRRRIPGEAESRALFRRAKLQSRLRVVIHPTDLFAHEQLKN